MTLWAILFLIPGPHRIASSGAITDFGPPPVPAYVRPDTDGIPPEHDSNLPNRDDEREGEEEDDGDSDSARIHATSEDCVGHTHVVCAAIAVANLRVSGLDLGTRVAILRC